MNTVRFWNYRNDLQHLPNLALQSQGYIGRVCSGIWSNYILCRGVINNDIVQTGLCKLAQGLKELFDKDKSKAKEPTILTSTYPKFPKRLQKFKVL